MQPIQNQDQFVFAPGFRLQWEEQEQSFVLLYPEGMIQTGPTAGRILYYCEQGLPFHELVQKLRADFDGSEEGIEHDVREFLTVALDQKWMSLRARP